jgi:hypothetical protein
LHFSLQRDFAMRNPLQAKTQVLLLQSTSTSLLTRVLRIASCLADESQYPSFKFQQQWLKDFASIQSDNKPDKVELTRTIICKSDRSAAMGFVMNFQPLGVDELVAVNREQQSAIWKVLLTKDIAVGKTVQVARFDPTAKDIFRETWSIISFGPPVIVLARTGQGANQTLVMNAHTGTLVYSTTVISFFSFHPRRFFGGRAKMSEGHRRRRDN